jgi:hypothetical protein
VNRVVEPELAIVHHCTPEDPDPAGITAGHHPFVLWSFDSVKVSVNPPKAFCWTFVTALAQWTSTRILWSASRALAYACSRRVWLTSSETPVAQLVASGAITIPRIAITVISSTSV